MTIRNIRGIGSFLIASGSQHSGHRALGKFPECHEHLPYRIFEIIKTL